ncbi:class I SAM-dependent methyltransferase [Paraburkholderia sp. DGU8]|uniref:class I SAM-dependent methyltransferase n=1 Tax=Paraburkholderia sp. DGU8 TaxID=3161997 RepID=UPI003466F958
MKSAGDGFGYNERLFAGGFRGYLHLARFHWVARQIRRLGCPARTVLEIGCFDGKLIEFLPTEPTRYVGYDADWEHALDLAHEKWSDRPNLVFCKATSADQMKLPVTERFDIAVSMETLEHVPPELVDGYLKKMASHVDGYVFVTVPNEKGPFFLAKWLIKKAFGSNQHYTFGEVVNSTLGRMQYVSRNQHKGFDYDELVNEMKRHFDVVTVVGFPFAMLLPRWCCFGIGIIAKPKK